MLKLLPLLIALSFQIACVSKMLNKVIPQEGKEEVKVQKVKKVAIVAFDTLEYVPSGLASKVAPMVGTAQAVSNSDAVTSELSLQLYSDLRTELKRKKFSVVPIEKVRGNSFYKKLLANMSETGEKMALSQSNKLTYVEGIARSFNPKYQFSEAEKKQLAKELEVDALVFARIRYSTASDTDYLGLGLNKSYLQPLFTFYMYDAQDSQLIWFTAQFAGPRSEESLGRVSGMENTDVIAKFSRPLAQSAIRGFLDKTSFGE